MKHNLSSKINELQGYLVPQWLKAWFNKQDRHY